MSILLFVILSLLTLLLLYVLFTPIRIIINSDPGELRLSWGPVVNAGAEWKSEANDYIMYFRIMFIRKEYSIIKLIEEKKPKKESKKPKKKGTKTSFRQTIRTARSILSGVKINSVDILFDTGDYCLNGILFPAAYLFNSEKVNIQVNFIGKNYLYCDLQHSGYRILKSFINSKNNKPWKKHLFKTTF